MLCDEAFGNLPDFAAHSILYKRDRLCAIVNNLRIPDVKKFYDKKFESTHTLEVLSKRYNEFLQTK